MPRIPAKIVTSDTEGKSLDAERPVDPVAAAEYEIRNPWQLFYLFKGNLHGIHSLSTYRTHVAPNPTSHKW